ncbi:MAG TPA: D-tyrosyl-tRNA(Tyr) deacylase [Candidatus Treponema faecavium]|nr:D-tyrosyl-tRNA(Tyr) deacylase [Candidatus Treponema faecavium]
MKAVVQRVLCASLHVNEELVSRTGAGLVVYLGIAVGDTQQQADGIAQKIANLRIFEDSQHKMNLSARSLNRELLLVSQFTLLADCSRGNRPGFEQAEQPHKARALYEYTAERLRSLGLCVQTGVFGADMKITQVNDGPVTILLEK